MGSQSEYVQFGKVGVNRAEAKALGKEKFMEQYKGKLSVDMEAAWEKINATVMMTNMDGNPDPKNKKGTKKKPGPTGEDK